MYDAYSKSMFKLKAILMWTINDFSAYGNMSGWPTKGRYACPLCRDNTCSNWLKHSRKFSYMGHRRFLAMDHPIRKKRAWFNGKNEQGRRPKLSTGEEIYKEVDQVVNDWGKKKKKPKGKRSKNVELWKKKSIFFVLPYWKVITTALNFTYII